MKTYIFTLKYGDTWKITATSYITALYEIYNAGIHDYEIISIEIERGK